MECQFKVGDRVQLKSGGPIMTVQKVSDDTVECTYFDNKKVRVTDEFVCGVLEEYVDDVPMVVT